MKVIKKILKLIKGIISSKSDTSHKRVLSIGAFFVLVCMVYINYKYNIQAQESLIYTFAGICVGESAMSVIDKFAK